jgi:glycosyltransferase involved in cell wall biosynthesis
MTLAATVLIPTHDHGDLLAYAVRSALAQTVEDIEIFIVGDGAPDATRRVTLALAAQDQRVRFFDNPKGPRHGEVHRHKALAGAQGRIVCYLGDDDLWLTDHVEYMSQLLDQADFAHALPACMDGQGQLRHWAIDLALPLFREMHLAGANRIPFSYAAHTLDMYRRLPWGWRTTPENAFTDLYMWQQFLAHPQCRVRSGTRPTVLWFPATLRQGWTHDQRVAEIERWSRNIANPRWREGFVAAVFDEIARERARLVAARYGGPYGAVRKRLLYLWWLGGPKGQRVRNFLLRLPLAGRLIRSVGTALIGPLAR